MNILFGKDLIRGKTQVLVWVDEEGLHFGWFGLLGDVRELVFEHLITREEAEALIKVALAVCRDSQGRKFRLGRQELQVFKTGNSDTPWALSVNVLGTRLYCLRTQELNLMLNVIENHFELILLPADN